MAHIDTHTYTPIKDTKRQRRTESFSVKDVPSVGTTAMKRIQLVRYGTPKKMVSVLPESNRITVIGIKGLGFIPVPQTGSCLKTNTYISTLEESFRIFTVVDSNR